MLFQFLLGGVKIETRKIDFNKKAKSKVNSFENIGHVPGGGRAKVIKIKSILFSRFVYFALIYGREFGCSLRAASLPLN